MNFTKVENCSINTILDGNVIMQKFKEIKIVIQYIFVKSINSFFT